MKLIHNIQCPNCHGPLLPTELHCQPCDLTLRGHFATNEFASLGEDDLHFLRIFILCEGRIRDMESALGLSYPSIKSRLANLKATLARSTPAAPTQIAPSTSTPDASHESPPAITAATAATKAPRPPGISAVVLNALEAGRITYQQAVASMIEKTKKDSKS